MSDFDLAQMMQLMQQDPTAGRELMSERLRAQAAGDPRMTAMLEMMGRREVEPPRAERPRAQRIRAAIREMREELAELHERNETLADALGACAACWGRVSRCGECRGRGRPGWREPVPELFAEFVAPVISKRGEP
jgi:hypothetical protein